MLFYSILILIDILFYSDFECYSIPLSSFILYYYYFKLKLNIWEKITIFPLLLCKNNDVILFEKSNNILIYEISSIEKGKMRNKELN